MNQFTLLRQNAPSGRAGMNGEESPPKPFGPELTAEGLAPRWAGEGGLELRRVTPPQVPRAPARGAPLIVFFESFKKNVLSDRIPKKLLDFLHFPIFFGVFGENSLFCR